MVVGLSLDLVGVQDVFQAGQEGTCFQVGYFGFCTTQNAKSLLKRVLAKGDKR